MVIVDGVLAAKEIQALIVGFESDRHVVFGILVPLRRYATFAVCTSEEAARAALRLLSVGLTPVPDVTSADVAAWEKTVGRICRAAHG